MVEKIVVDVEESLKYQTNSRKTPADKKNIKKSSGGVKFSGYMANGRTKPADKKELANKNIKKCVCPECNLSLEVSNATFGEGNVICQNCGAIMTVQY